MKNKVTTYLIALLVLPAAASAFCWQSVGGIESAVVITSNAGRSETFPTDPTTGEFYRYAPRHNTQTAAVFGGFAGVEWQASCNWDIQCNLHYNQSSPFSVKGTLTQGVDVASQDTYAYKYNISVRQVLFSGKFTYLNSSLFQPYVMAGVGPSFNKSYAFSTTVPPALTLTRMYKDKVTCGVTYTAGVGVDFCILDYVKAGISYRFTDFGRASLGDATIDGIPVSGTLAQSSFYASELFAQLTIAF